MYTVYIGEKLKERKLFNVIRSSAITSPAIPSNGEGEEGSRKTSPFSRCGNDKDSPVLKRMTELLSVLRGLQSRLDDDALSLLQSRILSVVELFHSSS